MVVRMTISIPVLILIGVLIFIGTLIQGSIGFGLGTVATPIVAMVAPQLVPMLILILAIIISVVTTIQTAKDVDWKFFWLCTITRLPGSAAGAWAVASLSHRGLSLFIGAAVIFAMVLSSFGWTPKYTKPNVAIASVTSGFLGTSTAIGGPPLALVLKSQNAAMMRGTLSATFVTASMVSIGMLTAAGQFNAEILTVAAAYIPVVLLGLWGATKISNRIDKKMLNRLVVTVSITAAVILIIKAAFGL